MCASNNFAAIALAGIIIVLAYWHFAISLNQDRGSSTFFYCLTPAERILEATPLIIIVALAALILSYPGFIETSEYLGRRYLGSKEFLPALMFIGPLLMWTLFYFFQTKPQIRKWFRQQNLELLSLKSTRFTGDNPWGNYQGGLFTGQSDSQLCYRAIVRDEQGKDREAYLLWGSYFGLEWLTGFVPIRIVWEKADQSETMIEEAADRVNQIRKTDPNDLFKPRW